MVQVSTKIDPIFRLSLFVFYRHIWYRGSHLSQEPALTESRENEDNFW